MRKKVLFLEGEFAGVELFGGGNRRCCYGGWGADRSGVANGGKTYIGGFDG